MDVSERMLIGVDGTDFGLEALRQVLVLGTEGSKVLAVSALDTAKDR